MMRTTPGEYVREVADDPLPHLRHTCATLALSARVNPKVVSGMLGHPTIAITLDIYSHVLPDMQQDAIAVMAYMLYG